MINIPICAEQIWIVLEKSDKVCESYLKSDRADDAVSSNDIDYITLCPSKQRSCVNTHHYVLLRIAWGLIEGLMILL